MEMHEYDKMDAVEKEHWWFRAKRKYLGLLVKRYAKVVPQQAFLLDIGCGTGAVMGMFRDMQYKVEGIDMSFDAVSYTQKKGLNARVGRAENLDVPDATYDIVIAADVLEHISDTAAVLREIYRVLKPGGIFVATVPAHQWLFSNHDLALHHVRRYSRSELKKVVGVDLDIVFLGWIHCLILLPAVVLRILRQMGIGNHESDVNTASKFITLVMDKWYDIEIIILRHCISLPWGLSLAVVATKHL